MQALETLEFKLAVADSPQKLSSTLDSFLCLLLQKLASEDPAIRDKTLSILSHINKRSASADVLFPVVELVKLFQTPGVHSMVSTFALVYIEMGFPRLHGDDTKAQCLAGLVAGYSKRSQQQQMTILNLIMANIQLLHPLDLSLLVEDWMVVLGSFVDVMLFTPATAVTRQALSPRGIALITYQNRLTTLNNVKVPILKFLVDSPAFLSDPVGGERLHLAMYLVFLAASVDPNHLVVSVADDAVKKRGRPSLEDQWLVGRLFGLYLGNSQMPGIAADLIRQPAGLALKYKILNLLAKSAVAANLLPFSVQVVFDSLYGPEVNSKVRLAGMGYMQWVIRMASDSVIGTTAQLFLSGVLKFLREVDDSGTDLRAFAFGALAALAKRSPQLFTSDLEIVEMLFSALQTETSAVRLAVQEALSSIADIMVNISAESELHLRSIVLTNIEAEDNYPRYCAAKFAVRLMERAPAFYSFVLLLACSDSKLEIRELCFTSLGFTEKLLSFDQLVNIVSHYSRGASSTAELPARNPKSQKSMVSVKYSLNVAADIVSHLRRLLFVTWDANFLSTHGTFSHITQSSQLTDIFDITDITKSSRSKIRDWMAVNGKKEFFEKYIAFLVAILDDGSSDAFVQSIAMISYRDYVLFSDAEARLGLLSRVDTFVKLSMGSKLETRMSAAHVLGLFVIYDKTCALNLVAHAMSELTAVGSKRISADHVHGHLIQLGFIVGRLHAHYPALSDVDTVGVLNLLYQFLLSSDHLAIDGALTAISEICRYFSIGSFPESEGVINKITDIINNAKEHRISDKAIMSLAHICLSDPSLGPKCLEVCFELATSKSKQVDMQLTVGAALSCILNGWESTYADPFLDVPSKVKPVVRDTDLFVKTIETILNTYLIENQKSPAARRSVCVWLLSLVKFCGESAVILERLPTIHKAFSLMLGDKDEFVQEIASKGIALVYSLGDAKMKEDLVKSLVGSFADDKGDAAKIRNVTGETELFDPGALGKTPDGVSVTTYKELCSLASELNKPDLVYKFMSLASHNHMWNSRKGAAFGFSEILANAHEELKPHLPSLIPKLYRYSFDPNPKVALSMKNIWELLVPDSRKAVDEYFDDILADILESMGNRLWRTRESACNALSDFLSGRDMVLLLPHLEKLWQRTFRALDDIKESVRKAAFGACRSLTNMTVRYCDPIVGSASQGAKIMAIVVPYMLKDGMMSSAEDVRKFALTTILSLCKKSGTLIAPFVSDIINVLLEAMSSMEPQVMNYLSFHTEKYAITQDQLDSSRVNAAKMSPMMEAVEICAEHVNDENLDGLTNNLVSLIRKGIGLPTKGGSARFVVVMCIKVPHVLRNHVQHCDSILKAISGAVLDRSIALRKSFAVAAGYIIKFCSQDSGVKFLKHLKSVYGEGEEKDHQEAVGFSLVEISKHSNDFLKNIASEILPICYFGSFDEKESIKSAFAEVWENNIGGPSVAVKLYANEILSLCTESMNSSSWTVRIQASLCLVDTINNLKDGIHVYAEQLLTCLINCLGGRTWKGKEKVLHAVVKLSIEAKNEFVKNAAFLDKVKVTLFKECNRNKKVYKRHALEELSRFLDVFDTLLCFDETKATVIQWAETLEFDEAEMIEEEEYGKAVFNLLRAASFRCLGSAWRIDDMSEQAWLVNLLGKHASPESGTPWNVKLAIVEALGSVASKSQLADMHVFTSATTTLFSILNDGKYPTLREGAVESISKWTKLVPSEGALAFNKALQAAIDNEESPNIKHRLSKLQ